MKSKIYKKLILLVASVLLVLSVISAVTLGWFYSDERAYVREINLSIDKFVEIDVTTSDIKFIVPSGYNNNGIAPGCLGYFTLHIDNSQNDFSSFFSIEADFDESSIPSNLQIYKGNFNPSGVTILAKQNIVWSSGNYLSGTGVKTICQNVSLKNGDSADYTIAFFWPYSSNSNNSDDLAFGSGSKNFKLKLFVKSQTV